MEYKEIYKKWYFWVILIFSIISTISKTTDNLLYPDIISVISSISGSLVGSFFIAFFLSNFIYWLFNKNNKKDDKSGIKRYLLKKYNQLKYLLNN